MAVSHLYDVPEAVSVAAASLLPGSPYGENCAYGMLIQRDVFKINKNKVTNITKLCYIRVVLAFIF